MERQHEIDEDQEIQETRVKSQDMPRDWQPNPETIKAMKQENERPDHQTTEASSIESEYGYSRDKETLAEREPGSPIKPSGVGTPNDTSYSDTPSPADDPLKQTQNEISEEEQKYLDEFKKNDEEYRKQRLSELRQEIQIEKGKSGENPSELESTEVEQDQEALVKAAQQLDAEQKAGINADADEVTIKGPTVFNSGDTPSEVKWVDRGIQNVPVDKIELSDSPVQSADDYKKVSHEEMVEGYRKLEEMVKPAVEQGMDGDYFSGLDAEQNLDHEDGYRKVYDAFYGDQNPIHLNKQGDTYYVVNGFHRLNVARELGIRTVPARVIEEQF